MMKVVGKTALFAIGFSLVTSVVAAQERVHALSGTVTSINAKIGLMEVDTDNGSSGHFRWSKQSAGAVDFDKAVKADSTEADKLTAGGAHVIIYFFGDGDVRTVVGVHVLGSGPIVSDRGNVVKVDRHEHLITIKNSAGAEESFHIDPKTVADTANGVVEGYKLDFDKGDLVQVTATPAGADKTALLIAPPA
jgi:hypothetical protein